ncbi:hypothetical protein GCM10027277_02120 [Pseudoduganella ginsengisoli]|nr:prepilin-type N-terminal cleavage/methylation domain-containing protein [Pseudoduganella ginsengisoli]
MRRAYGFTLVELIVVIVIIGIIAGTVTIYVGPAIQSYLDVKRRANLTDLADGAVRGMMRDIRSAVANSINVPNDQCFELVPASMGGRYRTAPNTTWDAAANAANKTQWVNTAVDTTVFDVMALTPANTAPVAGDYVVINNQTATDVYAAASTSRSAITNVEELPAANKLGLYRLTIGALKIDTGYDNARFAIVPASQQAVFYVCSGATGVNTSGDGKGTLYRFSKYGFAQNTSCPTPTSSTPIVATKVEKCTFVYDPNSGTPTLYTGYMQLKVKLTENNQSVQILVGTHTDNTP